MKYDAKLALNKGPEEVSVARRSGRFAVKSLRAIARIIVLIPLKILYMFVEEALGLGSSVHRDRASREAYRRRSVTNTTYAKRRQRPPHMH